MAKGILPADGYAGDLQTMIDQTGYATLWFCVRAGSSSAPARWSQVLLGQEFDGRT